MELEGNIDDGNGGIHKGENDKSQYLPLVGVERESSMCSISTMWICNNLLNPLFFFFFYFYFL